MCEPCKNNCMVCVCCDPCCNKSIPINCGTPSVCQCEEKFSDWVTPSFLAERIKQTTGKPKPLKSSKNAKDSKNDKSKEIEEQNNSSLAERNKQTTGKPKPLKSSKNAKVSKNTKGKEIEEQNNNSDAQENYIENNENNENHTQYTFGENQSPTLFQAQECQFPFILHCGLRPCPQRCCGIQAAGLPSRQSPMFDPCTGREIDPQAQRSQQERACPETLQDTGMYPCCCFNFPPYPIPREAIDNAAKAQLQKSSREAESSAPSQKSSREAKSSESSAKGIMTGIQAKAKKISKKGQPKAIKVPVTKGIKFNRPNLSKAKGSKDPQIVVCSEVNQDLIDRICKSLQVPRPPENCYLLLPITKSDKFNKSEEPVGPSITSKRQKTVSNKDTSGQNSSQPTRNCGCNTLISGNLEDNSQAAQSKKDEKNEQTPQNCYAPCCSSACSPGGCCCPRYSYYYNPCTGCYFW